MNAQDVLSLFGTQVIAFRPELARIAGGAMGGLWLSQALFYQRHFAPKGKQGFWTVSAKTIQAQTAMTRREHERARDELIERGLLESKSQGMPKRLWYRVNLSKISMIFTVCTEDEPISGPNPLEFKEQTTENIPDTHVCTEKTEDLPPEGAEIKGVLDAETPKSSVQAYRVYKDCIYKDPTRAFMSERGALSAAEWIGRLYDERARLSKSPFHIRGTDTIAGLLSEYLKRLLYMESAHPDIFCDAVSSMCAQLGGWTQKDPASWLQNILGGMQNKRARDASKKMPANASPRLRSL